MGSSARRPFATGLQVHVCLEGWHAIVGELGSTSLRFVLDLYGLCSILSRYMRYFLSPLVRKLISSSSVRAAILPTMVLAGSPLLSLMDWSSTQTFT